MSLLDLFFSFAQPCSLVPFRRSVHSFYNPFSLSTSTISIEFSQGTSLIRKKKFITASLVLRREDRRCRISSYTLSLCIHVSSPEPRPSAPFVFAKSSGILRWRAGVAALFSRSLWKNVACGCLGLLPDFLSSHISLFVIPHGCNRAEVVLCF